MKYLATIQSEFLKESRDWDEMSLEEQKKYLSQHRKSKRRLTAKPEVETKDQVRPKSKKQIDKVLKAIRAEYKEDGEFDWSEAADFADDITGDENEDLDEKELEEAMWNDKEKKYFAKQVKELKKKLTAGQKKVRWFGD